MADSLNDGEKWATAMIGVLLVISTSVIVGSALRRAAQIVSLSEPTPP